MKQGAIGTPFTAWRHFLWSTSVLESGLWPSHDVNGNPVVVDQAVLAGRPLAAAGLDKHWSCILLFMKGDLDFMANDVGLPHLEQ